MDILRSSRWLLLAAVILVVPVVSFGSVFISVGIAPPPLPVYSQPLCPGAGYIWTPGYWAYGPEGYFWVPGTWVLAPQVGFLWTPGWWGWGGSAYIWHAGYWGPQVGFYGGINYGYGYTGNGYHGGYWRDRQFYYNRSVNHVNVTNIHNTYNTRVVNNVTVNRVSYNGGHGGIGVRPTAAQENVLRERHVAPTPVQTQHEQMAAAERTQLASVNHGRPAIAATPKPTSFHGSGVVTARNAPVTNNPAINARPNNNANKGHGPENASVPHPPSTTANASHSVPRPPARETTPTHAEAPHANNSTVAHNAERPVPQPPAHVNHSEPRASNAPHENSVPRPPERESTSRPSNAAAPHAGNQTVAHNMGHPAPAEAPRETSRPPSHASSHSEPAPHASRPPAQHASAPHPSAPHPSEPPAQHASAPHQSAPHPSESHPAHGESEPRGRG